MNTHSRFIRKALIILVVMFTVISMTHTDTQAAAAKYSKVITKASEVKISDYTYSPKLTAKLQNVINGKLPLYKNWGMTDRVNSKLGSSELKNHTKYGKSYYYYVGSTKKRGAGSSCFIYADAVYYELFGCLVTDLDKNQESLKITGNKKITYDNFKKWGVRNTVGAYIRVGNHSIIILKYDSQKLTYIDGNGNGKGLVAIRTYSWNNLPSAISGTVSKIYQPKKSYYDSLFPVKISGFSVNKASDSTAITVNGIINNDTTGRISVQLQITDSDNKTVKLVNVTLTGHTSYNLNSTVRNYHLKNGKYTVKLTYSYDGKTYPVSSQIITI